jgi:hypothetical protein
MRALTLLAVLASCLGADVTSAETIRNSELGFTLEVPAGARHFPEGMQGPDMIHSYILKHPSVEGRLLTFTIERMHGTIGRSRMTEEDLRRERARHSDHPLIKAIPPNAQFDLIDETWQGFGIQVIRMRAEVQGVRFVAYIAQIPLRREAIQICVGCGQGNADEGRRLLRALLANLEGESNWTEGERSSRRFTGIDKMVGVLVIALLVAWAVGRRTRGKKTAQNTVPPRFPPYGPQGPQPPVQH